MPVAEEYARRLGVREAEVVRLAKLHDRIGGGRLALGAVAVLVAWGALFERAFSAFWLLIPLAAFVALVLYHSWVRRTRARAERAAAYYRHGIARIEDRWIGQGIGQDTDQNSGQRPAGDERFAGTAHIYAADLDLFGKGSLFELLCVARTRMGEDTLAQWLLSPASRAKIRERHASIADLRERLDLREEMYTLGEDAQVGVHPQALLSWAEAPNELPDHWLLWVALALPMLALATAVAWGVVGFAAPFVFIVLVEAGVAYSVRRAMSRAIDGTERAFHDLKLFAGLLLRMERNRFAAPALRELVHRLSSHTLSASATITRLARVIDFAAARSNPF
ncbi:MAG: MutS-related protein, partial [Steroidobacteraceae bacterium]